ncbi:hypothetical protein FOZ63_023797, partial [Perkinsus olseni]
MAQGVVVESNTTSQTYRPGEIEEAFQEFISKYGKRYATTEEYRVAKDAFAENLRTIASLRASADLTHEVGLNEYADVPRELLHKSRNYETPPSNSSFVNRLGGCRGFGAVVMESGFKLATGISKVVPFSVQQIVDCSQPYGNKGCDGGSTDSSMHYLDAEGIVKASSYPFKAKSGTCKTSVTSNPAKQCVKPTQFIYAYVPPKDEDAMMRDVATGPIAVSIYAAAPSFEFYKSGIITAKTCGVSTPDHFVTIVGYGTSSTGIPYWKIMNSWGKSWGLKGFAYIERTGNQP